MLAKLEQNGCVALCHTGLKVRIFSAAMFIFFCFPLKLSAKEFKIQAIVRISTTLNPLSDSNINTSYKKRRQMALKGDLTIGPKLVNFS